MLDVVQWPFRQCRICGVQAVAAAAAASAAATSAAAGHCPDSGGPTTETTRVRAQRWAFTLVIIAFWPFPVVVLPLVPHVAAAEQPEGDAEDQEADDIYDAMKIRRHVTSMMP